MNNPFLDENGYDHISQSFYCGGCGTPIEVRGHPVKDYVLCVWKHYGYISYPEVLAVDEKGFTQEGVVARPARKVLAPIPIQTRVQFCVDCHPELSDTGCGYCEEDVGSEQEYSEVECLTKNVDGTNTNFRTHVLHHDCLPQVFSKVKQYRLEHSI